MAAIKVTVRDGRVGRDPVFADVGGGVVLMEFETSKPLHSGEALILPDGTEVTIIGIKERVTRQQVVSDSHRR